MLITCPHCATAHEVPDDFIGPAGRKVRCRSCREIWEAHRPEASGEDAPTEAAVPAAPAEEPAVMVEGETAGTEMPEAVPDDAPAQPARTRRPRGRNTPASPNPHLKRRRLAPLWPALAAAAVLVAGAAAFRQPIVRLLPQSARLFAMVGLPVNLRGLAIADVDSKLITDGGTRFLVIGGDISNITRKPLALPTLRFAVRDAHGAELYNWTARLDRDRLEPGDSVPFRKRLAAPPKDGASVEVRFLRESDLAGSATSPAATTEKGS